MTPVASAQQRTGLPAMPDGIKSRRHGPQTKQPASSPNLPGAHQRKIDVRRPLQRSGRKGKWRRRPEPGRGVVWRCGAAAGFAGSRYRAPCGQGAPGGARRRAEPHVRTRAQPSCHNLDAARRPENVSAWKECGGGFAPIIAAGACGASRLLPATSSSAFALAFATSRTALHGLDGYGRPGGLSRCASSRLPLAQADCSPSPQTPRRASGRRLAPSGFHP